jgi:RNA polymerase sigma factor (sigma-70 family)
MAEKHETRDELLAKLAGRRFYEGICARLIQEFGLSRYAAENATSDGIEWAWRNLDAYDPEGRSLQSWVLQRAWWRALDYLTLPRARFEQGMSDIADVAEVLPDPEEGAETLAMKQQLEDRLLDFLGETPKLLVLYKLRRYWDLPRNEIAANLNVTQKEVKNLYEQLMRALKRFKAIVDQGAKLK